MENRQSNRLQGYDYSQNGAYFITVCAHNRQCLFGEISDGVMECNAVGEMIKQQWHRLSDRFTHIELHDFCVMPNHIHGIINIVGVPLVGTLTQNNEQIQTGQPQGLPLQLDSTKHHRGTQTQTGQPQGLPLQRGGNTFGNSCRGAPCGCPVPRGYPAPTIGDMVGAFKSLTTNDYIRGVKNNGWANFDKKIWQRNYYEHIIRNENELDRIRQYIVDNPRKWEVDRENPDVKLLIS